MSFETSVNKKMNLLEGCWVPLTNGNNLLPSSHVMLQILICPRKPSFIGYVKVYIRIHRRTT